MMGMLWLLVLLLIAGLCNILLGVYYNVSLFKGKFDWIKLMVGFGKMAIVAVVTVGLSYIFYRMPELVDAVGISPDLLIRAAIILYVSKAMVALGKILGVKGDSHVNHSNSQEGI